MGKRSVEELISQMPVKRHKGTDFTLQAVPKPFCIEVGHLLTIPHIGACDVMFKRPTDTYMTLEVVPAAPDFCVRVYLVPLMTKALKYSRSSIEGAVARGENIWEFLHVEPTLKDPMYAQKGGQKICISKIVYEIDSKKREYRIHLTYEAPLLVRNAAGFFLGDQLTNANGLHTMTFKTPMDQPSLDDDIAELLNNTMKKWTHVFITPKLKKDLEAHPITLVLSESGEEIYRQKGFNFDECISFMSNVVKK